MTTDTFRDLWAFRSFFETLFVDHYDHIQSGGRTISDRLFDPAAWRVVRARYSGDIITYKSPTAALKIKIAPRKGIAVEIQGNYPAYLITEFSRIFSAFRSARRELEASRGYIVSPAREVLESIESIEANIIATLIGGARGEK